MNHESYGSATGEWDTQFLVFEFTNRAFRYQAREGWFVRYVARCLQDEAMGVP